MAIKVVSEAKEEMLTQQLMDFLLGEVDATPKVQFNQKGTKFQCCTLY